MRYRGYDVSIDLAVYRQINAHILSIGLIYLLLNDTIPLERLWCNRNQNNNNNNNKEEELRDVRNFKD